MSKTLGEQLEEMERRFEQIERQILDPQVISQSHQYVPLLKEHGRLAKVVQPYRAWKTAQARLEEADELLSEPDADKELKQIAREEMPQLREDLARLRDQLKRLLLTEEGAADRNVIMEIRAGTGGEEAALFAADLIRMYARYAERRGWQITQFDARPTNLGGFKEATLSIVGLNAYRQLRFESGGHRVQRVPMTEAQGRIHTSLVTVAVLPEADDVEVEINPADIEMEFFRASGPGGQKVNKTSSTITRLSNKPNATRNDAL